MSYKKFSNSALVNIPKYEHSKTIRAKSYTSTVPNTQCYEYRACQYTAWFTSDEKPSMEYYYRQKSRRS